MITLQYSVIKFTSRERLAYVKRLHWARYNSFLYPIRCPLDNPFFVQQRIRVGVEVRAEDVGILYTREFPRMLSSQQTLIFDHARLWICVIHYLDSWRQVSLLRASTEWILNSWKIKRHDITVQRNVVHPPSLRQYHVFLQRTFGHVLPNLGWMVCSVGFDASNSNHNLPAASQQLLLLSCYCLQQWVA